MIRRRTGTFAIAILIAGLGVSSGLRAYTTFAKWTDPSVYFYVNPVNGDVSDASATSALQVALNEWSTKPGTSFRYVYGGRVSDTATGYDRRNVVLFRNAASSGGSGTIATTYWWTSGGAIVDADVVFWDGAWKFFTGTTGCSGGAFIEDVAAHELGHALGLNHSGVAGATMSASYSTCSSALRTLAADDIAGAQSLYGTASVSTNTAPVVSISSPVSNTSVPAATALSFVGSASDSQDGNLTSRLVWRSSVDGQIGTGGAFTRILSPGTHTIEARVTDGGGLTATRRISVTVTTAAAAPTTSSGPTLSARGYKTKGAQKADLSWAAISASSVDIRRNGVRIATTANDGSQTDAINKKGGGSYTYQVCAAGTSTCSNPATVAF